jgi:hypothetical protein
MTARHAQPLPNTTSDALDWMLEAFGPNGENWLQEEYKSSDDPKKRCLLGMAGRYVEERLGVTDDDHSSHFLVRDTVIGPVEDVLEEQYGVRQWTTKDGAQLERRGLTKWNDEPGRQFSEVVAVIEKARASCDA